ncbi:MAG: hypothetical protein L3J66_07100 [Bacteroidales bacterium]|nr:hypothetical protein [Bacteroidales bacterium]
MKKLLLFIGLLQFANVSAQQYGLVHNHLPAFYVFGVEQITFSIDSSSAFSGDTVYFAYTSIRDTSNNGGCDNCLDAGGGQILGRVLLQSDAKTSIINFQGDSVHYFRQTMPGESYVFYQYPNGMRIEATHFQSVYEEVLGTMDSVKYFSLQAFGLSGDSVDNDFNGEVFQLSQAHGLVSTFDNYLFPLLPYRYELSGFSNPVSGVYGIGWKAVFNIDIGDEFHIREQQDQWFYNEVVLH